MTDELAEDDPIYAAIDKGGGQTCNINGVVRELSAAGFVIVPRAPQHSLWVTIDGRGNGVTLSLDQWAELIAAANYPR